MRTSLSRIDIVSFIVAVASAFVKRRTGIIPSDGYSSFMHSMPYINRGLILRQDSETVFLPRLVSCFIRAITAFFGFFGDITHK